jgi:hypothetical protein
MDLLYLADLTHLTGLSAVRRPCRARVGGQDEGGHGDQGGTETSGVTLGDVSEHGNLSTALC